MRMLNMLIVCFLAVLAMLPTQYVQMGCGVVTVIVGVITVIPQHYHVVLSV